MVDIVFLGPADATFSYEAYEWFAGRFDAPKFSDPWSRQVPVPCNEDIIPTLLFVDGYGVIAMETKKGGRVVEPVESFIHLLDVSTDYRITVLAAYKKPIHFVLMAQRGTRKESVKHIIAHPQALLACREYIEELGAKTKKATSNGTAAASLLRTKGDCAALAPRTAAKKYHLEILDEHCEDEEAVTTFFLLTTNGGASTHSFHGNDRALVVFRLTHEPGALVRALQVFADVGMNMIHIHSMYSAHGAYDFAVELDITEKQLADFQRVQSAFQKLTEKSLIFGPFGVY